VGASHFCSPPLKIGVRSQEPGARRKEEEGRSQNKCFYKDEMLPLLLPRSPTDDRINVTTSVKRRYSEPMEILVTLVLGSVLFVWGMRGGRVLVRSSVTAKDLFKGRNSIAQAVAMGRSSF